MYGLVISRTEMEMVNRKVKTRTDLLHLLPKGLSIAELGVFKGTFSEDIISICEPKKLYLVDLFEGEVSCGDKDGENIEYVDDLNYHYHKLRDKYFNNSNVEVVRSDTVTFLRSSPIIDAVYIDSAHNFQQVYTEFEFSYALFFGHNCRKYILGHDYDNANVKLAVDAFCEEKNLKIDFLTEDKCPSYMIIL